MRIRTVKPDYFRDEKVGKVGPWARLMFIGLLLSADDDGNSIGVPGWLRGNIFPHDDHTIAQIQGFLDELEQQGMIKAYTIGDQRFYNIPNFRKHQVINRPSNWRNTPPPWTEQGGGTPTDSRTPQEIPKEGSQEGSRKGKGESRNRKAGTGTVQGTVQGVGGDNTAPHAHADHINSSPASPNVTGLPGPGKGERGLVHITDEHLQKLFDRWGFNLVREAVDILDAKRSANPGRYPSIDDYALLDGGWPMEEAVKRLGYKWSDVISDKRKRAEKAKIRAEEERRKERRAEEEARRAEEEKRLNEEQVRASALAAEMYPSED